MAFCWVPQNHQFLSQHQETAQKGVFSPQNAGHASLPGYIWALTLRLLSPGVRGVVGGLPGGFGGDRREQRQHRGQEKQPLLSHGAPQEGERPLAPQESEDTPPQYSPAQGQPQVSGLGREEPSRSSASEGGKQERGKCRSARSQACSPRPRRHLGSAASRQSSQSHRRRLAGGGLRSSDGCQQQVPALGGTDGRPRRWEPCRSAWCRSGWWWQRWARRSSYGQPDAKTSRCDASGLQVLGVWASRLVLQHRSGHRGANCAVMERCGGWRCCGATGLKAGGAIGGRRLQLQPSPASSPKAAGVGCGAARDCAKEGSLQVQPGGTRVAGEPGRSLPWGRGPLCQWGSPQDGVLSPGGWNSGAGLSGRGLSSSPDVQEKGVCREVAGQ